MKETDIQKAICDYLALKGYFFWRSNNTPIFDAKRGRMRAMPKYAMKGLPDICLISAAGEFIGMRTGTIDEAEYLFPFFRIVDIYLWEERSSYYYMPPPYPYYWGLSLLVV